MNNERMQLVQEEVEKFSKRLDEFIEAQNNEVHAPELVAYRGTITIKRHPNNNYYRLINSPISNDYEYLKPKYDNHKSFYKKAKIGFDEKTSSMTLYSYDTPIMTYYIKKRRLVFDDYRGLYSPTTRRHVYEMLQQWFNLGTAQYIYQCIMSDM